MKAITKINSNINYVQEVRILLDNKAVLDAAEEIIADQLAMLNRNSKFCHKPAEIGSDSSYLILLSDGDGIESLSHSREEVVRLVRA